MAPLSCCAGSRVPKSAPLESQDIAYLLTLLTWISQSILLITLPSSTLPDWCQSRSISSECRPSLSMRESLSRVVWAILFMPPRELQVSSPIIIMYGCSFLHFPSQSEYSVQCSVCWSLKFTAVTFIVSSLISFTNVCVHSPTLLPAVRIAGWASEQDQIMPSFLSDSGLWTYNLLYAESTCLGVCRPSACTVPLCCLEHEQDNPLSLCVENMLQTNVFSSRTVFSIYLALRTYELWYGIIMVENYFTT